MTSPEVQLAAVVDLVVARMAAHCSLPGSLRTEMLSLRAISFWSVLISFVRAEAMGPTANVSAAIISGPLLAIRQGCPCTVLAAARGARIG